MVWTEIQLPAIALQRNRNHQKDRKEKSSGKENVFSHRASIVSNIAVLAISALEGRTSEADR